MGSLLGTATALALGLAIGYLFARWSQRGQGVSLAAWRRQRDERRRADEAAGAVRIAEGRLEAAATAATDALLYVGPDKLVHGASPAAAKWFDLHPGYQPTLMAAVRSEELVAVFEAAVAGDTAPRTVRWRGRTFRARAVATPDGGAVLALRDETQLERLARAKRDLVANLSYELQTPLAAMGPLVAQLSQEGFEDPQLGRQLVAGLAEHLTALTELSDQLRDLERIESGQANFQLEPVAVSDLAAEAVASLAPQAREQQVRIELDIPADAVVLADRRHVLRVLTNILDNALRHSPAGGSVRIGAGPAAEEQNRIEVVVADEGPGLAPDDLDRVFERFYRVDRSRTGQGAGLGLAIARHIVIGHGGSIRAEHAPGGGAMLCFTLPKAE